MRFLLLNQCFYPDVVSTAQHLTDLAIELAGSGHDVTVITGDRGYDDPSVRFPARESWKGIKIIRVPSLSLGKQTRWRRALTFASFLVIASMRLVVMPRVDVVVALTSPPLISFLGALFVRLKGGRFFFWVMDLNPDEAIVAGWLDKASIFAKFLERILAYSLRHAEKIIVLDRFVKERILRKGIDAKRLFIIPPWAHDDTVRYDRAGREEFRAQCGVSDKFVVMYSGNHSPCHPLDALLEAALVLRDHNELVFYFIGGGSEQVKVKEFAKRHGLESLTCLPYQSLEQLSASLSAADLHVIVMGDEFAGIIHPCKIYNILSIGTSVLYIGPRKSHVVDIALQNPELFAVRSHGDIEGIVGSIIDASRKGRRADLEPKSVAAQDFSKHHLLPQLVQLLEGEAAIAAALTGPLERNVGMLGER